MTDDDDFRRIAEAYHTQGATEKEYTAGTMILGTLLLLIGAAIVLIPIAWGLAWLIANWPT